MSASRENDDDEFPTGGRVPFPYGQPYRQQVDLMDAILQALRGGPQPPPSSSTSETAEGDADADASGGAASPSSSKERARKHHRAMVMMLESPTGTGKSLSLACAAVAWLRHQERQDLSERGTESAGGTTPSTAATAASSTTASSKNENWWDEWKPPEEQEEERAREKVRMKAVESRKELGRHLQGVADRLQREERGGGGGGRTEGSKNGSGSTGSNRRERLVRLAISEACRRGPPALVSRQGGGGGGGGDGVSSKKRQRPSELLPPESSSSIVTDDFCLADYRSDSEENRRISSNGTSLENSAKIYNGRKQSSCLAKTLLDGAALDGSSACCRGSSSGGGCSSAFGGPAAPTPEFQVQHAFSDDVRPGSGVRKIVYAARTHSQLSQFVGELKRTAWGKDLRVVALGGRKALCGNESLLSRHRSEHSLTEACLDMQKSSSTSCPLKHGDAVATLALQTLARPTDIEEASALGKSCQACAYYAGRAALPAAEVVVMPYSMLLSKETRAAIGLNLRGSFVLVDEAHNLPEALRQMHSCRLTRKVVDAALDQLGRYLQRYLDRLAGRNLHYLGQLRKILLAFQRHLKKKPKKSDAMKAAAAVDHQQQSMISAGELVMKCKIDNVNLFKVRRYLEHSRLSQKLLGFTNYATTEPIEDGLSKHVSAMSIVETFLEKLSLSTKEGKFVTDFPDDDSDLRVCRGGVREPTIRYVLLRPAVFFENILEEARAVALVGGTLRPFVHVATELLGEDNQQLVDISAQADGYMALPTGNTIADCPNTSQVSRTFTAPGLVAFTCDHVVPSSNVLLKLVATGPSGQRLDFRHGSRFKDAVIDDLGLTLSQACRVVPNGVVVFLPSYKYEAHLVRRWRETGLWQNLARTKKLYREPKSAQNIDASLQAFSRDAGKSGALLFSVIGGKMSEGINFSNEMARCVVVVGLPYPDITDPELKEKMASMDATSTNKSSDQYQQTSSITGQAYYHNLCMRAVNQAVGRAIRSATDYAAIILADCRYRPEGRIWLGLPGWLRRGYANTEMGHCPSFQQHQQDLESFFACRQGA